MTKSVLDTLVLILLIVIILYYLGKMFGLIEPCNNTYKYGRSYEYTEFMDNVPKKVTFDLDEQTVNNSLNNMFDENKQNKMSESIKELSEKYKKPITTNADHVLAVLNNQLFSGQPVINPNPTEYPLADQFPTNQPVKTGEPHTTQDFASYQDNFINFNDKINYNTSSEVNTVDKLNEYNNDISRFGGMKISDIYDELVESRHCVNKNCIVEGLFDNMSNGVVYTNDGSSGKYIQNFAKKYETDDVNTGGKFYDNIEGVDDYFCGKLAL